MKFQGMVSLVQLVLATKRAANEESEDEEQKKKLFDLSANLKTRGVTLVVSYSNTLHDRQIRLSNGWVVKMGRGLDYFKGPDGPMSLGYFDLDLRPCLQTTVDIFFDKK